MKPVIFLDVDGVLNTPITWGGRGEKGMDIDKVTRLSKLVEDLDAIIVISSAWRRAYTLEELKGFLGLRGLKTTARVVGITPDISLPLRGEEVKRWLTDHDWKAPFVALDDQWKESFERWLGEEHYVLTSTVVGLQDEHVEQVKQKIKEQQE
jgi:hypothetical protein